MKTEKFDELVRQKIESVNPPFEEHEIDKVHQFITKNQTAVPTFHFGYIIGGTATGIMIASLLFWNFTQLKNEKQLVETIKDLKKNKILHESTSITAKPETVFVKVPLHEFTTLTKTITKQASPNTENTTPAKKDNTSNSKVCNPKNTIFENPFLSNNSKNRKNIDASANAQISTASNITEKNISPSITLDENISSIVEIKQSSENILVNNDGSKDNYSIPTKDSVPKGQKDTDGTNPFSSIVVKGSIQNSTKAIDNNPLINPMPNFLSKLHVRIGIGNEKANSQLGFHIFGDAVVNRWSFRAGLKYLVVRNGSYASKDEYQTHEGKEFSEETDDDDGQGHIVPKTISNININDYVIQMPISLSYNLPLTNNFYFVFGLGSDIDIYTTKNVSYIVSLPTANDIQHSVAKPNTPSIFNNFVASVGIEKRWKLIFIQLKPFLSPQLSTVDYKKESLYYGLNISGGFAFGG